ncbi:putative lipase Lih1p [[Candida] anglica]|uniref:triacylglycerol lipase n=1 Tax=[Candida] anglica TaxID=148631 RepID=A0ABP0EDL8_9ASCO
MRLVEYILFVIVFWAKLGVSEITEKEYNTLRDYAEFSAIAYCLKKGLKPGKLSDSCAIDKCNTRAHKDIEIVETFNFNDWGGVGSGYLALDELGKRIVLVFRGTASSRDWIGNLEFIPIVYEPISVGPRCDDCTVHKGFYNFLRENCMEIILRAHGLIQDNPDYKLVVTGHSLGAALTLLAGVELQLLGDDPLVISFGSPRIGNGGLAKYINKIFETGTTKYRISEDGCITKGYIRVAHDGDIVPLLPPPGYFKHSGVRYTITKTESPHYKEDFERAQLADSDDSAFLERTPSKIWPEFFGKYEHKHYITRITGCDDLKD